MSKLYRVTAIQPIYTSTLVKAESAEQALKIAESDNYEDNWQDFDIGQWYDYQAEEVNND